MYATAELLVGNSCSAAMAQPRLQKVSSDDDGVIFRKTILG